MSRKLGEAGEILANSYLQKKGYKILAQNYRWARGEIDLIAEKDDLLIFVEVKTASSQRFGAPETWVNQKKQRQIGMVAEKYLQEHEIEDVDCRFDVIAIEMRQNTHSIKHIENAFWLES